MKPPLPSPQNLPADAPRMRLDLPTLLVAALLIFLGGCWIRHVLLTLPFPYPVEYGEGVTINWAERLRQGLPLYPRINDDSLPWLHNPYGPVWFYLANWMPHPGGGIFTAARLLSVAAFAGSLLFIWRLARRDLSPIASVGTCALFGASPLVWRYAVMARVDMVALALSLAAIWAMEAARPRLAGDNHPVTGKGRPPPSGSTAEGRGGEERIAWWWLAGSLAAAAILVKPLLVAAMFAGIAAGARCGRKPLFAFAAGLGLTTLALVMVAVLSMNETALFAHFWTMNQIGMSVPLAARLAVTVAGRHPLLLAILVYGLVTIGCRTPRWWFAFFASMGLLSSAKIGADSHYYLVPLAAAALLVGPVTVNLTARLRRRLIWAMAAQLAMYLPVAPQPVFTATYGQEIPAGQAALTPGEADRDLGRRLTDEIAGVAGPVLADDPGYVLAAGKAMSVQPFQYGWLVRRGHLDPQPLLERIADARFALIMLRSSHAGGVGDSDFPASIVAASEDGYRLHREIGPYRLWVPDHDQTSRQANIIGVKH